MREQVIDLLNLWITVPDYFDIDWDLTVRMTIEGRFMMTTENRYCYMQYRHMRYWPVLDETAIEYYRVLLLYWFMLSKVTGKWLFDRNHGTVLLFIVYTVTVTVTVTDIAHRVYDYWLTVAVLLLLLSPYRPSILDNMDIDWFNWID